MAKRNKQALSNQKLTVLISIFTYMHLNFTDAEQGSLSNMLLCHISNDCYVHTKAIGTTAPKTKNMKCLKRNCVPYMTDINNKDYTEKKLKMG